MRLRQPAQLDTRAILAAALDAKGESVWHRNPGPDGIWRWHASGMWLCPRQAILLRAAASVANVPITVEENSLETRLTFELGHHWHALMQTGIEECPEYELVGVEIGGHHPTLPLAALADIVHRHDGVLVIDEVKSESTNAAQWRRAEAWTMSDGRTTAAKPDHARQIWTQAVVLEANGYGHIEDAWAVYIDKNEGTVDQQPVYIGDAERAAVLSQVAMLEEAWQQFLDAQGLPALLPDVVRVDKRYKPPREYTAPHGMCQPRTRGIDERGKYCRVRQSCYELAGKFEGRE